MRPPEFWRGPAKSWPPPVLQWSLTPASWIYAEIVRRRLAAQTGAEIAAKVFSVGGVSMGGSGKTPVARMLRQRLIGLGCAPAVLSRGYGGAARGVHIVDPLVHVAAHVGDEPLLHARDGLALISRDRRAGALAAIEAGADAIILDDAHQNGHLHKHFSVLVLDGLEGLGNGAVFPAGPLREPLATALARADCLICLNQSRPPEGIDLPAFTAQLVPNAPAPAGPLLAFAGIAFPRRFHDTLRASEAEIVDLIPFPDHHPFSAQELSRLRQLAHHHQARLVTTEKDWVRLPAPWREEVLCFGVSLRLQEPEALDARLRNALDALP